MDEQKKTPRKRKTAAEKAALMEEELKKKLAAQEETNKKIAELQKELAEARKTSLLEILDANEIAEPNQLQAILKAIEELDEDLIPKRKREKEEAAAKKAKDAKAVEAKTTEETKPASASAPQTSQN